MHAFLLLIYLLLPSCGGNDEDAVVMPTQLTIQASTSTTVQGEVTVQATAVNAKYYVIDFGDGNTTVAPDGKATHTYAYSDIFTIVVNAHATPTIFVSQTTQVAVEVDDDGEASLVWAEEFDGTSLNLDHWTYEIGTGSNGWGNNELQYYREENTSVQDGMLTITAKKENFNDRSYTSSRLITKGKKEFKYGRIDIRAKLPQGQGIWPALWMLGGNIGSVGWPRSGEIDIMEMIGGAGREKTVYGTLHWDDGGHKCTCDKPGYNLPTGTFADDFHVFTIIWDQVNIKWYVDDVLFNTIDIRPAALSEFHENFFFIVNLAVGGNWPGNPDTNTQFPQQLIVDYIRVYQ